MVDQLKLRFLKIAIGKRLRDRMIQVEMKDGLVGCSVSLSEQKYAEVRKAYPCAAGEAHALGFSLDL